jgi:hypothetical protein
MVPNSQKVLRLYPRGFLGADHQPQMVRSPNAVSSIISQKFQYHIDLRSGGNAIQLIANPHVEALYSQYIKRSVLTGSFEYREQVLAAALISFGTPDFNLWFESQFKSPACGDLHRRFLDDTLKFLNTGRREMSLETWGSLVTITDEGDHIGQLSDYAKDFFGIGKGATIHSRRNYLVTDVVQMWCSQPNGFEDLLGTLHILFGGVNV